MNSDDELACFGLAVRAMREAQNISQEELAAMAGLHRTYMGGVERGERNLGLINIFRIARALNCQPSLLIATVEKGINK